MLEHAGKAHPVTLVAPKKKPAPAGTPRRPAPLRTEGARWRITQARRTDPAFATYYAEIDRYPLLDAEEERTLGRALVAGRVAVGQYGPMTRAAWRAREQLTHGNLRLVVAVAACYAGQGVPLADIVGAGNIGLLRAVDKYDPDRPARFGTHATWWIREACSRYVIDHCNTIRLPRNVMQARHKIHRIEQNITQTEQNSTQTEQTGDAQSARLDDIAMAQRATLSPRQVRRARAAEIQTLSLDVALPQTQTARDGEPVTLADRLPSAPDAPTVEERATAACAQDELYRTMATALTDRERLALALAYGLGARGGVTMTNSQIGRVLGVSREKARQIVLTATRTLQERYASDMNPALVRQFTLWQTA